MFCKLWVYADTNFVKRDYFWYFMKRHTGSRIMKAKDRTEFSTCNDPLRTSPAVFHYFILASHFIGGRGRGRRQLFQVYNRKRMDSVSAVPGLEWFYSWVIQNGYPDSNKKHAECWLQCSGKNEDMEWGWGAHMALPCKFQTCKMNKIWASGLSSLWVVSNFLLHALKKYWFTVVSLVTQ